MSISYLSVQGVRNLQNISLHFDERYNFFIGPNGSGKTSLLEAIYLLGTARSFRTHLYNKVVHHEQNSLTVFGEIIDRDRDVQMGVQKDKNGETQIKINHLPCRQSAYLAQQLPLQLYYPDSFKIIDSSPKIRREVLDWGVFHVKHEYFKVWSQFQRVLRQRNAWLRGIDETGSALKWHVRQGICPWNKMLSDYAENIHQMRLDYFRRFLPIFEKVISVFFGTMLTVSYVKGWGPVHGDELAEPLLSCLERDKERDLKMGYTHHGPHKADIIIQQDHQLVKDFFSRGQQKLVIIAIKLAQGILLSQLTEKKCIYLLDDICAEFDEYYLRIVMEYLSEVPGQIFFTGINEQIFKAMSCFNEGKMFHVKQGNVFVNIK